MKARSIMAIVGALIALMAIGPTGAVAATEFGDTCTADEAFDAPVTFFEASPPSDNPLPIAAPSSGVLTKWKVNLVPVPFTVPQTLKVLRLNTGSHTALVVGETVAAIGGGSNTIDARIPVQTGDRLSIFGTGSIETLTCETPEKENLIGGFEGNGAGVGSSNPYIELPEEFRVPVAAVIEPDADGDGYGDETQDKCPQSATTQAPCPVVTLSTASAVKKALATISVTANSQTTVTVAGTAKLGKGKTAKLNGGTQIVAPEALAKFVLLFPEKLRTALKTLPKKRSLTLTVNASAPNVVGSPTVSTLKLHLKGQAKPKKHSHKKAPPKA